MRLRTLLLLLCLLTASQCRTLEQETCDASRMMVDHNVNNADVILGGLFEMRTSGTDGYGCGSPHPEIMLAYEAARWTISKINNDNYVNGIRLGMRAYDTCYSPYRAVAAANDFYPQFSSSSMYCNQTGKYNLGILGAYTSWTTKPVASLTKNFPASMISPVASSPELSDKTEYPYFMRTGLSSSEQIRAMMAAMDTMNWERIVVVYSDNDYGADAMREMVRLSTQTGTCVIETIAVPPVPNLTQYVERIRNIGTYGVNGAVYFGDHFTSMMLLEAVDQVVNAQNIQWMFSSINMNEQILPLYARGIVYVQPQFTEVTEFFNYFTNNIDENNPPVENPWYQDWFMQTFQCRLQGINYAPYNTYSDCSSKTAAQKRLAVNVGYAFIDSTIKAVYAFAKALRTAHAQTCGNVPGMCLGLRQMTPQQFHTSYLQEVDLDLNEVNINSLQGQRVRFDNNGDFYLSAHEYWNYNNQPTPPYAFKKVGNYVDGALSLSTNQIYMYNNDRSAVLASLPMYVCPSSGCRNCVVPRPMVQFTYSPGDIVLGGLFDLHAQGSEVLLCGALKPVHALNAAAFRYAIRRVKQNFPNILNGVDLGSLIVDLCDNGETGRLLLNNLLGGRHIVGNVDPNLLKTVVGELDSTEAISMASMLGQFSMPYVESSATSVLLYDKDLFPTFLRAIPSDYHQMLAVVLLLKRMNWNYVQVVYTGDAYGKSGYEMIKAEGAKRAICVAASHEIGKDGSHAMIVGNLMQKPDARVVIAVVDTDDYRVILEQIQAQGLQGNFVLIGTETWGKQTSVVDGYEAVADGSVTLQISPPQITEFRQWLSTLNPTDMDTMEEMPFFGEWYQYAYNCYLSAENRGVYPTECNPNFSITQAPRYVESPYTPFMIYATYAAARAIDETVRDFCGDANRNYQGLCWQFRSNAEVKSKIQEHLRNSQFMLNGYNFLMKSGEGMSNYELYSYTNRQYVKIGTYLTNTTELQMDYSSPLSLPPNFASMCMTRCSECVYLTQTSPFTVINSDANLMLGVNFALHNPGTDPFLCGTLRLTNGIQSYLAVYHALNEVNVGRAPVQLNVPVGALLLDHCNSDSRAYGLPSALYSGILGQSEPRPNLNAIRTWLTDNTLVTEGMKDFFSELHLPVVSPMATTNKFLNTEEYPTFLRTIQGDSTIATAMAILAKSLGLQYVTVLYSANSFGREGKDTFYDIALQEGLCIIKMFEMGSDSIDNITQALINQPTHVVVTILGEADMDTFLAARGRNPNGNNLVIISPEPYPLVYYRRSSSAQNVFSLRMKANTLDRYRQFIATSTPGILTGDHPLLAQYYMELFQCNLPGEYKYTVSCGSLTNITANANFFTDNYVLPIMNSVYTFVAAAHETLIIQCGADYNEVCANFYADPNTNTILMQKMREVSYVDDSGATFGFIGQEGNTGREIVLFDSTGLRKVADFAGASINILDRNLRSTFDSTRSSCNSPCTECINNNMNFTYIPGDIMLGGIFDVHKSALTPFSCGDINTLRGFQLLEAFHFAINKVNDKSGPFANVLKNVKLGGVGLDACESAVKGGYMVSNIHSGLTTLEKDGTTINPESIDAYIGTYSSGMSIYLARLLKTLKIPQISFGSTSVALLDQDRYPYFLRTVPADDRQAMGMIRFLRKYEIRYVQIVHTADNYGEQGAQIFAQLAEQEKVCVAQTVSFIPQSTVTDESANDVVLALLEKPIANTVIVFADTTYINELLQAIRRNPDAHGKFKFIGSDTWANNPEPIDGVQDLAVGSVTVDLDVVDIPEFDDYLSTKTPANYPENPWFPEYYEEIQNCYLTIPNPKFPGRCSATPKNIVTSRLYKQDTALIHVINAVFAAAYGLDMALREACGNNYTTVCEAYKNLDSRRDFVLEKIKLADFTDLSKQRFNFSERGDGNKGYVMYSIDTSVVLGYVYNPIARYTSDGKLQMTKVDYTPSWDGSCERVDSCTECPTIRNLQTRYMLSPYLKTATNPNPATLIYTADIHGQGNDEYRCGEMNIDIVMGALSVLYTLEHSTLIADKPFDLRVLILDNCNNQLRIDQDLFNILTTGTLCNSEFDSAGTRIDAGTVLGVMTPWSRFVVAANRVTAPLKIQLMSSTASSTAFSDQWRYPYFARTVPPDNIQMEVIAKILQQNGWTYVSVIYTTESYGINGYRTLQQIVNDGLYSCIGASGGISPTATVADVRPVVKQLAETEGIGVMVLIVLNPRVVLEALKAEGLQNKFFVIGTDTWATQESVLEDRDTTNPTDLNPVDFAGSISLDFRSAHYNAFVEWVKTITYQERKGMPNDWFEEFYQHIHKCMLTTAEIPMTQYQNTVCNTNEQITDAMVYQYTRRLGTIAAAYTMGNGLSKLYREYNNLCVGQDFETCLARVTGARDILFSNTLAQTWSVQPGQVTPADTFNVELGDDRYWNVGYNIYSVDDNNMYYKIGSQSMNKQGVSVFLFNNTGNYVNPKANIVSRCPEGRYCDCTIDDVQPLPQEPQVKEPYMRDHEPRNYFMYDEDTGERVYEWPIWAIAVAVLTCVGLLAGLLLFFYFLIFYPVRGGTTILGFLMMLGLFGVYAINFAFFKPASESTCGTREFLQGVVYAVVLAPLFVKAVDNWRFKDSAYSPKRYVGLTHPVALVLIALGIIAVQCIIPIEWLILRHPSASLMANSTNQHDWMWCDPHDFYDISLVLSMSFVVFLVILTAVFSALAWDSESNYYESRWIFVSCVCTAGCFLVWMVVSTNAGPPYRDPAVAIANFVNATAILIFIPLRKFILLIQFSNEEEMAKTMPIDEANNELYSTVYSNQAYQPVFEPDGKPGSEDGY